MSGDLVFLSASQLAKAIRERSISAKEVLKLIWVKLLSTTEC